MSGRMSTCQFKTGENQQFDAKINLRKDRRSCVFGTVVGEYGMPVADAVVKLLQVNEGELPIPLTHTFTDKNGQFLIGPLCPNTTYMLKVYKDDVDPKELCGCPDEDGSCISSATVCKCGCRN